MADPIRRLTRRLVPRSLRRGVSRLLRWPPVGHVNFGQLRRLEPMSRSFGSERGTPIDRHYIEDFLEAHADSIRGRVLEIGTDMYTKRFGGSKVAHSDVLHVAQRNPGVTIIADLTSGDNIPAEAFDCVILTQTLQVIYDVRAVLRTVHRILAPGGTVLATIPGITPVSRHDMDRWGFYWSFTTASAERLFREAFPADRIEVRSAGNVLAATAFLQGFSC